MYRDSNRSLVAARTMTVRISVLFVVLLALWILVQSGIPIAAIIGLPIEHSAWSHALVGWFFVVSAGWLLYLLMMRNLRTVAEAQEALRLRDRAIESSINAIVIIDYREDDLPIVYVNPAFERMTGYTSAEAIGRNPRFLAAADVNQPELQAIQVALKEKRDCRVVLRSYRKDGTLYWNELHIAPVKNDEGEVTHYVGVQNDITAMKKYQSEIEQQANFDSLTGLPNRNLLTDRAATAIVRAGRDAHGIAVVLIDLDNFRLVNDSLGHAVGNQLLRLVGERLGSALREMDTIARLGGDEFVLVLGEQESERTISSQMQRIVDVFARPFVVEEQELFVTVSIGVASYPQDGEGFDVLLKNAEVAMYRAKDLGRNTFQFYAAEMNARVAERLTMENWLRRAVEHRELLLHFQPQLDLRTGHIFGAEALIRWQHPKLGMVSPAKFIPMAEQTGLIVPIGEWVLRAACAQNKAWQDAGLPRIAVAVNISARQFREKSLLASVAAILEETGLEPRFLELEVTESAIMHDAEGVIAILQQLKAMGVMLSIDDFGTGYSSLSYLKRFPVDRLKIDQSFIRDLALGADSAAIVQAVITLGHSLNLKVIAEGVETAAQLQFLRQRECDEKQGYFFSRPLPAEEFRKLLEERRMLAPQG